MVGQVRDSALISDHYEIQDGNLVARIECVIRQTLTEVEGIGTVNKPNRPADNGAGCSGAAAAGGAQGYRYAIHTRVHNTTR